MLDVMRSNARSSLIVLIFGAIIVTFIFSFGRGSSGFRTRTPETWAAKVNGDVVTAGDFAQAYASRFRQISQQRGGKYTAENAKQDDLRRLTLKSLVDQELIAQQAKDLGIVVTDQELSEAIAKSPQFQQNGSFDFEYYKRLVENGYGMSVPRFEDAWRRDMLRAKALQSVLNGAQVSDDEVRAYYVAQHESASVAYVRLTGFMFRDKAQATEAEAEEYANAHAKEIEAAYEKDAKTRWTQPPSVKARVITVRVPPGSTAEQEKEARARIEGALAEVKGGKDFSAVAKEKSEDATKESGGDLGFVSRGASPYGKTLEDEASKLEPGQLSSVFKDRTGFHVLKAEEKKPERVQPLEEVRKQIAQEQLRAQNASELARQKAQDALAAVKAGKDLKDLYPAKKTEPGQFDFTSFTTPQAQETEPFHPVGGYVPGIGLAPKLSSAVFALTSPGSVPDAPVQDADTWYVFRLKTRERADLSKLDEEKASLRERLEGQRQGELYQSWLERLRKKSKIVENVAMLDYDTQPGHESFNPDDY
ncbi:MAG TPA: SurA N-terminal domain-containing protein [Myxococcales bacterium]